MTTPANFEAPSSQAAFLDADRAVELTAGVQPELSLSDKKYLQDAWLKAFYGLQFFDGGIVANIENSISVRITDEPTRLGALWYAQRRFVNAPLELGGPDTVSGQDMYRLQDNGAISDGTVGKRRQQLRLAGIGSVLAGSVAEVATWHSPESIAAGVGAVALAGAFAARDSRKWPQKRAEEIKQSLASARQEFDTTGIEIRDAVVDFEDMPPNDKIAQLDRDFVESIGLRVRNGDQELYAEKMRPYGEKNTYIDPSLKPVQIKYSNISEANLYLKLLRKDSDPEELWVTHLRDSTYKLVEMQSVLLDFYNQIRQAINRQQYTGITNNEELDTLWQQHAEVNAQAREHILDTLVFASERHVAQKKQTKLERMLGKHRELIEATIVTPDTEVQHPQAEVLRVFRDVLYDAAIQTEDDNESDIAALDALCVYVEGMAEHLTSGEQSKQFYLGLLNKKPAGCDIILPEWDAVAPKFISASINS